MYDAQNLVVNGKVSHHMPSHGVTPTVMHSGLGVVAVTASSPEVEALRLSQAHQQEEYIIK